MNKTLYIAGPMRGKPEFNYPEFNRFAFRAYRQGWAVINPVDIGNYFGPPEYLEANPDVLRLVCDIELRCIPFCSAILLLPGWESSTGAREELRVALAHNLGILFPSDFP